MYKIIKSTSAHLGLVFVFIGIAVAPASLKVTGLGSILSGAAQTWRQVTNIFGANYQPVDAVELSALNGDSKIAPAGGSQPREGVCEQSLVASLIENGDSQIMEVAATPNLQASVAATSEPARCDKEKSKPVSLKKRGEPIVLPTSVLSRAGKKGESFEIFSTDKGDLVVKVIGKQLAEQTVELKQTLKAVPMLKYGDLDFKLKLPVSTAPKATPCKQRPVPTPEQREALRLRAAAMSIADMPAWGPENSEF